MVNNIKVSVVVPTYKRSDKLERLVDSIVNTTFPNNRIEIIIVDDSGDLSESYFDEVAVQTILISNEKEQLLSQCRNQGISKSKGEHILVIDDDNVVSDGCITELSNQLDNKNKAGLVAPVMCYYNHPNTVWWAGSVFNRYTSLSTYQFAGERLSQIPDGSLITSNDAPNAYMVNRETIDSVGMHDEKLFPIEFEHTAYCQKVIKSGFEIYVVPKAIIWHDISKNKTARFDNSMKVYYRARNRILIERIYADPVEKTVFYSLLPAITITYIAKIINNSNDKRNILLEFIKGTVTGLFMDLSGEEIPSGPSD